MRHVKACLQCRNGKRRCDRAGASACKQCVKRNLACSAAADARVTPYSPGPSQLSPAASSHVDTETLYLVELYFRFMHDKPHSLFHEPSFKAGVMSGTTSRSVLLSMIGLSARFAEDPDVRSRGPVYFEQAKKALKDGLEHICLENIQACILIGNICRGDSDPNAESLYFGEVLATRMAQILNLGVVNEADDGVTRETKVRLWWSCFILDTWASGGSNLSRHFVFQPKRPRVPMDEVAFFNMKPGEPDIPESQWKPGLWGHMVRLVEIYSQIQDLHKHLSETTDWDEILIENAVRSLDADLLQFETNLEPETRFSRENLALYVSRGIGRTFIAFHIGYYHYWTLLFYIYLDHRRPPTTNGKIYASRCKYYATVVCDILRASREQPEAEALYNIVGHVTVVSSSVLVHTYLFGEVDELPDAKRRLESNLESLMQLRSYWPSLEQTINRLVIFQNNCLKSFSRNTHRFDRWMVKFLVAHALALEEKPDDPLEPGVGAVTGSDTEHIPYERSRVTHSIIMDIRGV